MKNLPFTLAVLVVINEFVKAGASFSAYDVTKTLRQKVGTEINITDPLPTDDNSGKTLIEHSAVRQTVHDAYENNLIPNYTRQHQQTNGVHYWNYVPTTSSTVSATHVSINGVTTGRQNGTITVSTNAPCVKSTLSGDAEAKVREYILNRHKENKPVTIKGIQGMIFRRARISSEDIANEVGRMGFTVTRQPGLKPSLSLVQ